jgi:hypothetical protein
MSVRNYGYPTPRNQCWPNGVPFVLPVNGMQMFQHPDRITIMYSVDHQVRHIRLNSAHPANVTPSWYGDSVAHYEGDTLVIDTIAVKKGPFPMIDWYGTPFSDKLHIVSSTTRRRRTGSNATLRKISAGPKSPPSNLTGWI